MSYHSTHMMNGFVVGYGATTPAPANLGPQMCANPLPPGRYAIKVYDNPLGAVRALRLWADNTPGVSMEATKDYPAISPAPAGVAAIFSVSAPAMWNQTIWGCPNVADKSVNINNFAPDAPAPSLWEAIFGAGSKPPSLGLPAWVYLAGGAVVLVALAPTLFEVSKVVAVRQEQKGAG